MEYYPKGIDPIHHVTDWGKIKRFTEDVEAGASLPPILVDSDRLLTGTHRWVTNEWLAVRNRNSNRIRVVELQLLPIKLQRVSEDALAWHNYWEIQHQFHQWWYDQYGCRQYHLRRSDPHDPTPETPFVAEHRHLRELAFVCESCGEWWPDAKQRYECCFALEDRLLQAEQEKMSASSEHTPGAPKQTAKEASR